MPVIIDDLDCLSLTMPRLWFPLFMLLEPPHSAGDVNRINPDDNKEEIVWTRMLYFALVD